MANCFTFITVIFLKLLPRSRATVALEQYKITMLLYGETNEDDQTKEINLNVC